MGFLQEFKTFALKGNVLDMAVGVIIGNAFGKIVSSLVNDVIMPPLGLITGGVDFKDLGVVIRKGVEATEVSPEIPEVVWKYGAFIQNIVDFLIIAACIFTVIKLMNKFKKQKPAEEPKPIETPEDIKLLTEIRDLLKKETKKK